MSYIILVCGLAGSGKSTLAEALATRLKLPLFSKDKLEASVVEHGLVGVTELNGVGYTLLKNLVDDFEARDQPLILDFVADRNRVMHFWPQLQTKPLIAIECVCSDTELHRMRIEQRQRNLAGWYELSWQQVQQAAELYTPLCDSRLILDSVKDLQSNIAIALDYVSKGAVNQ